MVNGVAKTRLTPRVLADHPVEIERRSIGKYDPVPNRLDAVLPIGDCGVVGTGQAGSLGIRTYFPGGRLVHVLADPGAPDSRPSLFTVIREQWAMKLEPAQGPLKVIVVDSAQRPTEN
jgi:hypothetical protein